MPEETQASQVALGARFRDALAWAAEIHAEQARKGTSIPYASHLLAVCALVLEHGGDENQAIAALLHDAIEDHPDKVTIADVEQRLGPDVAKMVAACTDAWEHPKPPWRDRKEAYIASIASKYERALLVSYCDKLHNARAILADHRRIQEQLWERFTGGRDGTLWYYRALVDAFRARGLNVGELDEVVGAIEREAADEPQSP